MSPEHWTAVKELFNQVVDLDSEVQQERLRAAEENEGAPGSVVAEVRHLLRVQNQAGSFLSQPIAEAAALQSILSTDSTMLEPGEVLDDRFEVQRLLGAGGMGYVFLAHDRQLGEQLALKTVRAGSIGSTERLYKEVQAARRISHRNVCRVHDVRRHEDLVFFTMAYIEGETLAERLERGRLTPAEWDTLAPQICDGLAAAHEAGVLHRDLKPSNILISSKGEAVITDFGLARSDDDGAESALAGTRAYMAPEVVSRGQSSKESDIYSLGVLLDEAIPLQGRPAAVERAILSCLHFRPGSRPGSASEVAEAFRPKALKPPSRRGLWIAAGGAAVGGAILWESVSLFRSWQRLPVQAAGIQHLLMTRVENSTKDARFDFAGSILETQLGQSATFRLLSQSRVSEILRNMQKEAADLSKPLIAREVALRHGKAAVLYGGVSRLAETFRLDMRLEVPGAKPDEARYRWDKQFPAFTESELLDQIRAASNWVRQTLGELPADINAHNQSPADLTTPSWDALALLNRARTMRDANPPGSEQLLKQALELDPGFTSALRDLADLQVSMRRLKEGYTTWSKAIESSRRRQLNSRERFRLEAAYQDDVDDLIKAAEVNSLWMATYENDYLPRFYLGNIRARQYRPVEALTLLLEAEMLAPESTAVITYTGFLLGLTHDFSAAAKRIAKLRKLGRPTDAYGLEIRLAAMRGDYGAALTLARKTLDGNVRAGGRLATVLLIAAFEHELGETQMAEEFLLEDLRQCDAYGVKGGIEQRLGAAAMLAFHRGDLEAARQRAAECIRRNGAISEIALVALARAGDLRPAEQGYRDWVRETPVTAVPRFERARLRILGEIQSAKGNWDAAITALEQAERLTSSWWLNDSLPRTLWLSGRLTQATSAQQLLSERKPFFWTAVRAEPAPPTAKNNTTPKG